jgi:taurine dioxygenase
MEITQGSGILGATVTDIDLGHAPTEAQFRTLLRALGQHGVLCFPDQHMEVAAFANFGRRFGALEINVANQFHEPDFPEVMVLSNIRRNGRPIGLGDAGQGWHTDMSYSRDIALANILHAQRVPKRDGMPLGDTQFRNMHAAYDTLPADLKRTLEGRTATHDFIKFWDMMRSRPGSERPPLTDEQRRRRPPVSQPLFRDHPITGRRVLYANPGYTMWIDGMPADESTAILERLFAHQAEDRFLHVHHWTEGDVLIWDNIGTTHNAVADYREDEPRYMRRVQVMATLDYSAMVA